MKRLHNSSKAEEIINRKVTNEDEESQETDSSSSGSEDEEIHRWDESSVLVERSAAIEEQVNKVGGCKTFKINQLPNGKTILIPIL